MSDNNKGLEFYDNLDLTHSHNDEDLQVVYKEWAPAYDLSLIHISEPTRP